MDSEPKRLDGAGLVAAAAANLSRRGGAKPQPAGDGVAAPLGCPAASGPREEEAAEDFAEQEEYDDDAFGDADGGGAAEATAEGPAEVEEEEWDEIFASPLAVRFTQDKIHPFFYRRGPIVNVVPKIRPVLRKSGAERDAEEAVIELVPPFNPIHCIRKGEELWSLDNRRLYALQLAAMEQWPRRCHVRLLCRDRLPRHKFKTQYRKFNTTSEGSSISVCARYQQFDTWSWFDRAVEIEWYTLSQRLGVLLSLFEVLPVVGALLFRTGLTGFSSRLPLVVGFLLAFATDFLRQKVPVFERRLCELHVRATVAGEVGPASPLRQRLRGLAWRGGDEEEAGPMSGPQLAATMVLALALLLPYVLGVAQARVRSSLLSCWLGVACVLAVQLGAALRCRGGAAAAGGRLSPKGRG